MWVGAAATFVVGQMLFFFVIHAGKMAQAMSEPQIMTRRQGADGGVEIVDDFREVSWFQRCSYAI